MIFAHSRHVFRALRDSKSIQPAPRMPRYMAIAKAKDVLGMPNATDEQLKRAAQRRPSGQLRELLSTSAKSEATETQVGAWNRIMYLAPAHLGGMGTVCPWSSQPCRDACLNTAGHGHWDATQRARVCRTIYLMLWPEEFHARLLKEVRRDARKAALDGGKVLAVRLDGTSDLGLAEFMPPIDNVVYYDYTKSRNRAKKSWPNWHVTLSAVNVEHAKSTALQVGRTSMALVVRTSANNHASKATVKRLVQDGVSWWRGPIVNGDLHDARYLDEQGSLVLLSAKGDALGSAGDDFCWDVA